MSELKQVSSESSTKYKQRLEEFKTSNFRPLQETFLCYEQQLSF